MKSLFLALVSLLASAAAEAHPNTIQHINRALDITNVEMQAIYSGRYRFYRPETIRNILSQLSSEATSALQTAEGPEARKDLADLLRSINEEYNYSFRFQHYRLESTRLLMLNYQRFLTQARQSENIHGGDSGHFNGCNGAGRVGCL